MSRLTLTRAAFLRGAGASLALTAFPRGARAQDVHDVVIVGGGLAGLTTALRLAQSGVSDVVVLEARDRVGGRTLNLDLGPGHVVEGGGEWIGPGQDRIAALAAEVGVGTFPAWYDGQTTYDLLGTVSRGLLPDLRVAEGVDCLRAFWALDALAARVPRGAAWEAPDAAALDAMSLADWLTARGATPFTHAVFKLITRAVMAGHPDRISLLWVLHYIRAADGLLPILLNDGGAQDLRFHGGSQRVSLRLQEELGDAVRVATPVAAIQDLPGAPVEVTTRDGVLRARRVLVATTPGDTLRIDFTPSLPAPRQALARGWARLTRLPLVKASLVYATPFWRAAGLNGAMQSDAGPIQLVFDNSPPDASLGVLTCFLSLAEAPGMIDARTRQSALVDVLVRTFGPEAAAVTGYVEKDWATDPWGTGCITPLPPGLLSATGASLRPPVGRIHWAGTETSDVWCGYMDGAVRSGERAATELIAALRGAG